MEEIGRTSNAKIFLVSEKELAKEGFFLGGKSGKWTEIWEELAVLPEGEALKVELETEDDIFSIRAAMSKYVSRNSAVIDWKVQTRTNAVEPKAIWLKRVPK